MTRAPFVSAMAMSTIGLWAASVASSGLAQVPLNDPTRAPFQLRAPAPMPNPYQAAPQAAPQPAPQLSSQGPQAAAAGESAAPRSAEAEPPAPRHRVTSVMLGSGSRPSSAIVDGRLVRAGDRIDGLLLVGIDAAGVTLQSAKGAKGAKGGKGDTAVQRLPLFARPPEQPPAAEPNPKDGDRPDKDKP